MPGGAQGYVEAKLSDDEGRATWHALHEEVQSHRLMAPQVARTLFKLAFLGALLSASLAVAWAAETWTGRALGWTALAFLLAQFAFIGHDAGHGSVARGRNGNRAFGQVAMTLVTGLAFDEWIARHHVHHRFCQEESRDPDMMVGLVASLTESSLRGKGRLGRFLTRHQFHLLWLLALLFGHSQRHLSQFAVLLAPRRFRCDALFVVLHYALWFGVPCGILGVPVAVALLAYVVPLTLLGPYLAGIFWVNHVGMPLIRRAEEFSFFEHQVVTSRSILNPPAWDWLFGGLNFQIEHHLFPQVPSSRLHKVQRIVRAHFAYRQIPYNGVTWLDAARAVAGHFQTVGRRA